MEEANQLIQSGNYIPRKKDEAGILRAFEIIAEEGISIAKALQRVRVSRQEFYIVINNNEEFKTKYARACELRAYLMAEEACEIFESIPHTIIVNDREEQNHIGLAIAKAKAENLKWYASKLNKALGDKPIQINTQINSEKPIILQIGNNITDLTE